MWLMTRYDSRAGGGPIRTASSANRTNGASASASEYTATVAMPIALHVRITRSAISPRFATSSLLIVRTTRTLTLLDRGQHEPAPIDVVGADDAGQLDPAAHEVRRADVQLRCELGRLRRERADVTFVIRARHLRRARQIVAVDGAQPHAAADRRHAIAKIEPELEITGGLRVAPAGRNEHEAKPGAHAGRRCRPH